MKKNFLKTALLGTSIAIAALTSCKKSNGGDDLPQVSGPDVQERKYITLTGAFPDAEGSAGNGGTRAFAISTEQALDPNFEINVFADGYSLRSQRTARVQASANGNYLYNIQYTGNDGGIFNKYLVKGGKIFQDTREEVNTEPILGSAPRWVVAAEGIGIGVYASAKITASKEGAGADFVNVSSTAKIAVLNLDDPQITRQTEFTIPLTAEQTKAGYQIGRIDVPILNASKTKIFIGCNLTRTDATKQTTVDKDGNQEWSRGKVELGTATLVVDYPSLQNPQLIYSENSKVNNHSYRTMTQHLAADGSIYQATATSGSQILKINGETGKYDNAYNFDLKSALGASNALAIRAWKYLKNNIAVVLYTETGVDGGYIAMVDLTANSAIKLTTENQTNIGFSGRSENTANGIKAITGTFGQFQNICAIGELAYVPMTPNGVDGNLYIINTLTKQITKGAKLKNQSGSFYLGAY